MKYFSEFDLSDILLVSKSRMGALTALSFLRNVEAWVKRQWDAFWSTSHELADVNIAGFYWLFACCAWQHAGTHDKPWRLRRQLCHLFFISAFVLVACRQINQRINNCVLTFRVAVWRRCLHLLCRDEPPKSFVRRTCGLRHRSRFRASIAWVLYLSSRC